MKHKINPADQTTPVCTQELLERAKSGDKDALSILYERSRQSVYRTINAMIRDEDLTMDIQQDTYVAAFSHLDQLQNPDSFLPWIRRIAVNEARMQLRKKKPLLFTEITAEDGNSVEIPIENTEISPELSLDTKETSRLIRQILDGLSDLQRMLVGMYYYEEIPLNQIAEDLGLNPGTAKSLLFRSRKKIETEVRRLEEKGVKLYGMAPVPFVLALLKKSEPAAETSVKALPAILTESGVGQTVVIHAGRRFLETVVGKVVIGLVAAGLVTGGIWGYRAWKEQNAKSRLEEIRLDVQQTETENAADSDEDLVPDQPPTIPVETELVVTTAAPEEMTEPVESEQTDPVTTDTEPAGYPIGAPAPTGPAEPSPVLPSAAESRETEPAPAEQDTSEDHGAEETGTDALDAKPELLHWAWSNQTNAEAANLYDMRPETTYYLSVFCMGNAKPEVYADQPGVVNVTYLYQIDTNPEEPLEYVWSVTRHGSGTTTLSCALNGKTERTLSITNIDHSDPYVGSHWNLWKANGNVVADQLVGKEGNLIINLQQNVLPNVYTDNPSVLKITNDPYLQYGAEWYEYSLEATVETVGYGSANIYIEINGTVVDTYRISVPEYPKTIRWVRKISYPDQEVYHVGISEQLEFLLEGNETPQIYTDHPEILSISTVINELEPDGRLQYGYASVYMKAIGDATVFFELEGKVLFTVEFHIA